MKLRDLFTRKREDTTTFEAPAIAMSPHLELDALDDCVGGRSEADSVACYAHSTPPSVH